MEGGHVTVTGEEPASIESLIGTRHPRDDDTIEVSAIPLFNTDVEAWRAHVSGPYNDSDVPVMIRIQRGDSSRHHGARGEASGKSDVQALLPDASVGVHAMWEESFFPGLTCGDGFRFIAVVIIIRSNINS